tara:strand:+ start:355 stop:738 length:384 start_codon:yes stop_codon:yes gene_type:complete
MKKFLSLLLIVSLLFPQEICEGECYTDEEAQNIELYITELEQKDSVNINLIKNLKEQIELYEKWHTNDSLWITLQKEKIALLDERIDLYKDLVKEVEPNWYENKWIWFGLGTVATATSINLASKVIK